MFKLHLSFQEDDDESILSFCNNINTSDGGTHVSGFKTALTRVVNNFAKSLKLVKDTSSNLSGDDVREGLSAIISVRIPRPEFSSQTKTKLGTVEAEGIVNTATTSILTSYFDKNAAVVKKIVERALLAQQARAAAKKSSELIKRKGFLGKSNRMPGKLYDCNSEKRELSELFIVEGDSAAGCFSGDTKVALADGRNLSFYDLVKEDSEGKENFCYMILEDGSVGVGKIKHPRITKQSDIWIKITLDNGEIIESTLDHLFMVSDGTYVPAKELEVGTSLKPLYRKLSSKKDKGITIDGYEMVWQSSENRWVFTHMLADQFNLDYQIYLKNSGNCRHHIDFNKLNNNPTNILRMDKDSHLELHRNLATLFLHSPESKQKAIEAKQTEDYRKKNVREDVATMLFRNFRKKKFRTMV
jgi:DNA gyrase subunit B